MLKMRDGILTSLVHSMLLYSPLAARAALGAAFLCAAYSCSAQIFVGSDERGAVLLSNFASDETPDVVVAAPEPLAPAAPAAAAAPRAAESVVTAAADGTHDQGGALRPVIEKVAKEVAISPKLLQAVIQAESGFKAKAVSPKGAIGLMQLMPETAARFGVRNAYDPLENIRGGATYLKWLLEYFRGDVRLALAGYNAGELAVVRAGYRIPPIAETIDYVPKVLGFLSRAGNG